MAGYPGICRETLAHTMVDLEKMRLINRLSRHEVPVLDDGALANLGRV